METNGLDEKIQSAYKTGYSTKMALLPVTNCFLVATDNSKAVIVVFLDLSVAFNTVGHDIMRRRLKQLLGLRRKPLDWLRFYL